MYNNTWVHGYNLISAVVVVIIW